MKYSAAIRPQACESKRVQAYLAKGWDSPRMDGDGSQTTTGTPIRAISRASRTSHCAAMMPVQPQRFKSSRRCSPGRPSMR